MTAEEAAKSREVRSKVRAVESPPPPADLRERVERLYAVAQKGDRDALLAALRDVVPAFTPSVVVVADGVTPKRSR